VKVIGYLRVSTDAQADGQGLDVQREAVQAWARKHRHRLVAVETDVGRSGADVVGDRPGLVRALARLANGEAAGIVVYRLDRLARDMILQETILADLHRVGLQLHSTSAAEDEHLADEPDDPTRALVRRILGAVSAYERDVIRMRLRAGRERKKLSGGFFAGTPPYGWRTTGGKLAPIPAEQSALKLMRKLRREERSYREICEALTAAGIPTRLGHPWHPNTVRRILARPDGVNGRGPVGSTRKELEGVVS
jgi:DNA invertase Pin-like site-specific DNA recombinase